MRLLALVVSASLLVAQYARAEDAAPPEFSLPTAPAAEVDREGIDLGDVDAEAAGPDTSSTESTPRRRYDRSVLVELEPPVVAGFNPALADGGVGHRATESCPAVPASMTARGPVEVRPGRSLMLAVSRKHLNRIITPFVAPDVLTNSQRHDLAREGNVLVLSLPQDSCDPIGLFIFDRQGDPELALNLTLFPQDIPQAEVRLTLPAELATSGNRRDVYASAAPPWDYRTPHVDVLTTLLKQMALGEVPPGFAFEQVRGRAAGDPVCAIPGVSVVHRQRMVGPSVQLHVAVAKNTTDRPVEIGEHHCASPGVLAVAAWPQALLGAGESTELFIVAQTPFERAVRTRPSALER